MSSKDLKIGGYAPKGKVVVSVTAPAPEKCYQAADLEKVKLMPGLKPKKIEVTPETKKAAQDLRDKVEKSLAEKGQRINDYLETQLRKFGDPIQLTKLNEITKLMRVEHDSNTGRQNFYFGDFLLLVIHEKKTVPGHSQTIIERPPLNVWGLIDQQLVITYQQDPEACYYFVSPEDQYTSAKLKLKDYKLGDAHKSGQEGVLVIHSNKVEVYYKLDQK